MPWLRTQRPKFEFFGYVRHSTLLQAGGKGMFCFGLFLDHGKENSQVKRQKIVLTKILLKKCNFMNLTKQITDEGNKNLAYY